MAEGENQEQNNDQHHERYGDRISSTLHEALTVSGGRDVGNTDMSSQRRTRVSLIAGLSHRFVSGKPERAEPRSGAEATRDRERNIYTMTIYRG